MGRLVFIGLMLAAVAVGTFVLVDRYRSGNGSGGTDPATVVSQPVDVSAGMDEGRRLIEREEWEEAGKAFGRVLQVQPEHEEAQRLRKKSASEAANQRRYNRILKDVDDAQWADAFFALDGMFETFLTVLDEFGAYPAVIETADGPVTVFDPGFPLHWRVSG